MIGTRLISLNLLKLLIMEYLRNDNILTISLLTVLMVCAHVERKTLDIMMACGAANPLKAIVQQIKPMVQIGT